MCLLFRYAINPLALILWLLKSDQLAFLMFLPHLELHETKLL